MLISGLQDIGLLVLRLGLGTVFIAHGWTKIKNPAAWAKKLGLPTLIGLLVSIGEFFGGLGVFFGCLTQIAAFGPLFVMTGALRYHIFVWKQKFISHDGGSWEYPFMLLLCAIALIFLGGGAYSIDAYIGFYP